MKWPTIARSCSLVLLVQSSPVSSPQQPPAPKGSIEGIVLRVVTGEPIEGARISYVRAPVISPPSPAAPTAAPPAGGPRGTPPSPPNTLSPVPEGPASPNIPGGSQAVTTDRQGKFVLRDLDAGSYRLTVAANGYARQEYGQRAFVGLGTPIRLDSGQAVKDIVVGLTPAGNISGRIVNDVGQPTVVPVQLLRATYNAIGERSFQSAGSGRTNDRGEYRLYWITPGRYILNAGSFAGIAPVSMTGGSPNEVQENSGSTFYPGVSDLTLANVIEVQPGVDSSGIDFSVTRQQLYQVHGSLVDSRTGQAPTTANIQIGYRTLSGGSSSRTAQYNAANGTFEVRDVAPGSYFLITTLDRNQSAFAAPRGTPRTQTALTVSDSNVDGIVLTIGAGVSIPGRLIVEGQALSTVTGLDRMRVQLSFVSEQIPTPTMSRQPPQAQLNPDGIFQEDDVMPGDYRVTITSLPPDFYVKEARFDQTDVLGRPLHFSGSVPGPLDIVLSPKAGRIAGTVVNDTQQPMPGVRAVLIPDQHRDRIDLYKTATTDQNGSFTISGISPGDYKVFAWEAIDQFGYFDPDLLRQSESRGKPVQILESSKESLEVKVIPATGQ